ncbi:MAG: DNA primase, partial [Candidatus Omnitrophota bacterium]
HMEHMTFPEAIRFLADKVGIAIEESKGTYSGAKDIKKEIFEANKLAVEYFHNILLSDKSEDSNHARNYLKKRGLELETVKKFQIGFALNVWDGLINHLRSNNIDLSLMEKAGLIVEKRDKKGFYDRFRGRVIFPIHDAYGNAVAFGARTMVDDQVKYINSPETYAYSKSKILYGMHFAKQAISQQDEVVIVEGYLDCVTPKQAGIDNMVASCGTALTVEQIRFIRRFTKNVVLLYDTDAAGIGAMIRSLDILVAENMQVRVASLGEGQDPDSFVLENGPEALREHISKAKTVFEYKFDYLSNQFGCTTIESKAKIIEQMLVTINKFENEVVRTEYVSELARKLNVSKEAINKESLKGFQEAQPRQYKREKDIPTTPTKEFIPAEERTILSLILTDQKFISKTRGVLEIDDFQSGIVKDIVTKIYELGDHDIDVDSLNSLINLEDQKVQDLVSELMLDADHITGDKIKMHDDCIQRIKKNRSLVVTEKLNAEIRRAEADNDLVKLNELLNKKNQLSRK